MTQPRVGTALTISEQAEQAGFGRKYIFEMFEQSEYLMLLLEGMKAVGDAVVCVPAAGQPHSPNGTVRKHPRYQLPIRDLIQVLSPDTLERRTIAGMTLKMQVLNPKYVTNRQLREVQAQRVQSVARLVANLTNRPVCVRFQGSDGHNHLYIDEVIRP